MKILFINRGDIDTVSGGYIYNSHIIQEGMNLGYDISYSDSMIDGFDLHIVDSLMFDSPEFFDPIFLDKTIALVHQLPKENQSYIERELSVESRNKIKYIVTGSSTADLLQARWSIREDNIEKVLPGIEDGWKAKGRSSNRKQSLILVANYIPNKGYENLMKLIPNLYELDLYLDCFGNTNLDFGFYSQISEELDRLDPERRISLNLKIGREEINEKYLDADLFMSLSENESYGMAIHEALSTGLPVIMFRTGEWRFFDRFELCEIVENGNLDQFVVCLKDLIKKESSTYVDSESVAIKRTWTEVGKEFFSHVEKNVC